MKLEKDNKIYISLCMKHIQDEINNIKNILGIDFKLKLQGGEIK